MGARAPGGEAQALRILALTSLVSLLAGPTAATIVTDMITGTAFVGGMRGPHGVNAASWPLARLTLDATEGTVVGLRRGFALLPFLPAMRFSWKELDRAEGIRGGLLGSSGVRLVGRSSGSVLYWTRRPGDVLTSPAACGVIVQRSDEPPRVWFRP